MNAQSKTDFYKLLDEIEREACKESFYEFLKSFWDVIIKEKAVFNWHIPFLCAELQELSKSIVKREKKPYDLIINIPPGTTKSTVATIMWPAWLWTQDPTIRIITNSYSMDLSIEHATKSRDILTSEKFKRLFPDVKIRKDKGAKTSYENTSTGARYSTSTGGTITGKHAHIILNDDPLNPSQAASDADRKTANEHTKTLSSRKVDKANTPSVTIMQRLHEEDVTGYLLKKKGETIRHINLPAEDSPKVLPAEVRKNYVGGLLDPTRLSRAILNEAMTDLGSMGYAGQYDQSPTAKGGNVVKAAWFKYMPYASFQSIRTAQHPIVFFMDTAYTDKSEDNDPTGIIATCKVGNDLYIVNAAKVYKEFPDLIKYVPEWTQANGYSGSSTVRIEPKASGLSVVQTLKRSTSLNITTTPTPKDDKKTRLTASSPKIECGRVILITSTWNEEFVDEICGFPNKNHDEYVDLIAYAIDYHLNIAKTNTHEIMNAFA